ncbi:hypothetical protein, partial [Escherichia coli]|uniref:hypothetical protein n=1 Tax=Escherichia coli TaxID=562 RepID=UPI00197A7D04
KKAGNKGKKKSRKKSDHHTNTPDKNNYLIYLHSVHLFTDIIQKPEIKLIHHHDLPAITPAIIPRKKRIKHGAVNRIKELKSVTETEVLS